MPVPQIRAVAITPNPEDLEYLVRRLREENLELRKRNEELERRFEERRVIDKAKHRLMERFRWPEPRAFRYLQVTAMNRRMRMVNLAERLLEIEHAQS